VQDSADEYSIGIRTIDDNVFSFFDAPVSLPDLVASAPHLWNSNQPIEATCSAPGGFLT
jgi:hypothetical protein